MSQVHSIDVKAAFISIFLFCLCIVYKHIWINRKYEKWGAWKSCDGQSKHINILINVPHRKKAPTFDENFFMLSSITSFIFSSYGFSFPSRRSVVESVSLYILLLTISNCYAATVSINILFNSSHCLVLRRAWKKYKTQFSLLAAVSTKRNDWTFSNIQSEKRRKKKSFHWLFA